MPSAASHKAHIRKGWRQSLLTRSKLRHDSGPHLISSLLLGLIYGGSAAAGLFRLLMKDPATHFHQADWESLFLLLALAVWLGIFFLTIGIRTWKGHVYIAASVVLPWILLMCLSVQGA